MNTENLIKQIIEASEAYYEHGNSKISDREFDSLIEELRNISPKHPLLTKTGWGYKVIDGVPHKYHEIEGIPNKIKSLDKVPIWDVYYITPKLDGASVVCYYEKGILINCLTRGDGKTGRDVTRNLIGRVPFELNNTFYGYIRCEAVISKENFEKHFPADASLRNAGTGLLGAKTPDKNLLQYLDLVPTSVYSADINQIMALDSGYTELFPNRISPIQVEHGNIQNVLTREFMLRLEPRYLCDGLVATSRNDRHIFAYKFDEETVETVVTKVEWVTQDTGKVFPTVWYEPVEISGCTATKASGKSFQFIGDNNCFEGAKIKLVRSGEIIPNILEVLDGKGCAEENKPKCSFGCDRKHLRVEGANLFCRNPECPSNSKGIFFRLLDVFAPKGFSEEMKELTYTLFASDYKILLCKLTGGRISFFCGGNKTDLLNDYNLEQLKMTITATWLHVTPHQESMIWECLQQIKKFKIKLVDLARVAIIDGFGETFAKRIEEKFKSAEELRAFLLAYDDISSLPVNSKVRASWKERYHIICVLLSYFSLEFENTKKEGSMTLGKETVCITGKLEGQTKAEFADKYIIPKGFEHTDNITNATILINAGGKESTKTKKAAAKGIKIMTVEEYLNL